MMNEKNNSRSRWGRARFGGRPATLVTVSLAIGALITAGLATLFVLLNNAERPGLVFVVFAASTLPIAAVGAWAVLVGRSTLAGAIDEPQDSIETAWYNTAASGAFGDILIITGLGLAVFVLTPLGMPAGLLLLAVVLVARFDFGARYLWLKKTAA